jgi:acetyl esterase/lipase
LISAFFFVWFFTASIWTLNALRRPVPPGRGLPPMWLPGMIVSELAPVLLVLRGLVAWVLIGLGAAAGPVGVAGLVLFTLSELGLLVLIWRSVGSARATAHSPSVTTLWKVWERLPPGVEFWPGIHYWNGLTLDLYRQPGLVKAPTLIYLHPGSWMRGRPGRQARALIHRLALRGWVVLDIRYPLSPAATFPDHLIGVRRAIGWAKTDGRAQGVDPNRIVISGGSSGAHLAALAALTADHPTLARGPDEDVSVAGCLALYGIYDLLVRNATRYDWPFIARRVMKAKPAEDPGLYRLGSPLDQVGSGAPPFFVIHGEFDSVVLPAESEHFAAALAAAGGEVSYHQVGGAQHGFDAISSLRTRAVAEMCVEWLKRVVARQGDQEASGG